MAATDRIFERLNNAMKVILDQLLSESVLTPIALQHGSNLDNIDTVGH